MKILLVYPPFSSTTFGYDKIYIHEPIALEYAGAGLSDKHEVQLLDMRLDKSYEEYLREYNPDVIGFTSYILHVNTVKKLCKIAKGYNNKIFTVIGGYQATICPESFDDCNIDALVLKDGVFAMREIVDCLEKGEDYTNVKGIAYRKDGKQFFSEKREYPELDSLPIPDRDLTMKYREHYFNDDIKPIATVITSKGCPHRCSFCSCWQQTGGLYKTRSIAAIIDELKSIEEPNVHFADDESFIDHKRMEELADAIEEAGIKKSYFMYVRTDTVLNHIDLIKKWSSIGLKWVQIGMESHRDKDFKSFGKSTNTSINEKATSLLYDLGITVFGSFIINPDYVEKDFDDLSNYIKTLKGVDAIFTVLTPLPGTKLYSELKDQITTHNYDLYDFCHAVTPTKLSLKRFYSELGYMYVKKARSLAKDTSSSQLHSYMNVYQAIVKAYTHHDLKY